VANIKSQVKRNRSNERRRQRNLAVRSELKTRVKNARDAIDAGSEDSPEAMRLAQKRLGMAAAKGRIHKNAAARRTSRIMKRANTAAADDE
jgi:small subunit ribosomal protein S20